MPQDIPDHQLARGPARRVDHGLGRLGREGQRLFYKDVRAGFHRGNRQFCVTVGVGADGYHIGLARQARRKVGDHGVVAQLGRKVDRASIAHGDNLERWVLVVGQCVGLAHLPKADDENFQAGKRCVWGHFSNTAKLWNAHRPA